MFWGKPITFWIVVLGMAVYIAVRDADSEHFFKRISKTVAAVLLGIGFAPELSAYFGISEALAAGAIIAFGQILLDTLTAILRDGEFLKKIIRKKFGGDDE